MKAQNILKSKLTKWYTRNFLEIMSTYLFFDCDLLIFMLYRNYLFFLLFSAISEFPSKDTQGEEIRPYFPTYLHICQRIKLNTHQYKMHLFLFFTPIICISDIFIMTHFSTFSITELGKHAASMYLNLFLILINFNF